MCVVGNVLKTGYYYYITTVTYFSCAKDANHSQMLGSPDPLVLSIPLKLIGADVPHHRLNYSAQGCTFLLPDVATACVGPDLLQAIRRRRAHRLSIGRASTLEEGPWSRADPGGGGPR